MDDGVISTRTIDCRFRDSKSCEEPCLIAVPSKLQDTGRATLQQPGNLTPSWARSNLEDPASTGFRTNERPKLGLSEFHYCVEELQSPGMRLGAGLAVSKDVEGTQISVDFTLHIGPVSAACRSPVGDVRACFLPTAGCSATDIGPCGRAAIVRSPRRSRTLAAHFDLASQWQWNADDNNSFAFGTSLRAVLMLALSKAC